MPAWRQAQLIALVQLMLAAARHNRVRPRVPFKTLESLAGKLQYVTPLIRGSRPFTKGIYRCLFSAIRQPRRPKVLTLSPEALRDLHFWDRCLPHWNGVSALTPPVSDTPIYTDASPWGFGLVFGTELVGEPWHDKSDTHINILETLTVYFALRRWAPELATHSVRFIMDNTTALHCLRRGGSRNPHIQRIVEKFWLMAAKHSISPVFEYINTKDNDVADALSRGVRQSSTPNWPIVNSVFEFAEAACGPHTIDLMASPGNNKCPRFRSRCDSVFSHTLDGENAWCNPDFALLTSLLNHFFQAHARAPATTTLTLVVPEWPHQPWWPLVQPAQTLARFPIGSPLFLTPDGRTLPTQWPVLLLRWGPHSLPTTSLQ
jgi:hypothetical protein